MCVWVGVDVSNLNDERANIAAALTSAGVKASTDPRAQVPVVVVSSPTVLGPVGIGAWSVEYPVHVLGVPPGNAETLDWLLQALEGVLGVFPGQAVPRTIEHAGQDVPAYVVTVTRSVSNPNC